MKKFNDLSTKAAIKIDSVKRRISRKLEDNKGQFAMDNGIAIVIAVALGAVLLTVMILYFKGEFSDGIKSNINNLFSQS